MSCTHRRTLLEGRRHQARAVPERIARAHLLVCIVRQALDTARPLCAGTARIAVDELRAMVSASTDQPIQVLHAADIERLARAAALPEVDAIDFRREQRQEPTELEQRAWERIEHFARLVLAAAAARAPHPFTCGAGTGLAAAAHSSPAPEERTQ